MTVSNLVRASSLEVAAFAPEDAAISQNSLPTPSAATSVLNPVPLPQPSPSSICNVPTPAAEPQLSDLTFQTIAAAAIPQRELQSRTVPLPSVQSRRAELGAVPILGLSNFPVLSGAQPCFPNPASASSALTTFGGVVDIHHEAKQEQFQPIPQFSRRLGLAQITPPDLSSGGDTNEGPMLPNKQPPALTSTPPLEASCHTTTYSDNLPTNDPESRFIEVEDARGDAGTASSSVVSPPSVQHDREDWVSRMVPKILSAIRTPTIDSLNSQVRVLTHALPIPSASGYCFPRVVAEIQSFLTPQKTTWISHWHAVSGRFNISKLPTTPPATPAAPHEGEDYFTIRTFDSAVSVPDYQQVDTIAHTINSMSSRASPAMLPPHTSPRPAVPPSSVHISITERYIPPTSPSEFVNMYDPSSGRSLISDRLVELSEDDGILIFVYPTRAGGKTFLKDYLGPTIDPLLRRMMIVNNLGINACEEIGGMTAVNKLPTFEEFERDLRKFCHDVTFANDVDSPALRKLRSGFSKSVRIELIHAKKEEVSLTTAVWTDWWCRQEKPRIRSIFDRNTRQQPGRTRRLSSGSSANIPASSRAYLRDEGESDSTSMTQILEVLNGVESGAKERSSKQSLKAIEVGVFIIKKSTITPET